MKCNCGKIYVKHAFQHSAEVVFINLYWKDDCSGKTNALCKHKSSSLHNQAVKVINSLPRIEAVVMLYIDTYYPNCTGQ